MGGAEHAGGGLYEAVAPFPPQFNLCDYYLDRNLREGRAEKVALICGGERRTYAQIAVRVRKLAAAFRRAKLRPEERVLIVLPDGFEFAEAWFATLRAGGVFAMVNPLMKREQFECPQRVAAVPRVVNGDCIEQ